MANGRGKIGSCERFYFLGFQNNWMVTVVMNLRHLQLGRKAMTNLDSIKKTETFTLPTKVHNQIYNFFSSNEQDVRVGP